MATATAISSQSRYSTLTILLSAFSLVLLLSSVLFIQQASTAYGAGAGALIQSQADSRNVTSILSQWALNVSPIYTTVLIEYVAFVAALGMVISSVLLYRSRSTMSASEAKSYTTTHGSLMLIYVLLFIVNLSTAPLPLTLYYFVAVYAAMIACAAIDLYVIFSRYIFPARGSAIRGDLQIDPSTPYSNLLRIKESIFGQLSGSIGIVDKHMNSVGIENFYRLMQGNFGSISEVNILTSKEMLDNEFWKNYLDCKSEAENAGTAIHVMVMSDEDSAVQHERFVFDDKTAYKVPPFNIIHKKSEHITRIRVSDAKKRFDQLYGNSMKYENFITRKSQDIQK